MEMLISNLNVMASKIQATWASRVDLVGLRAIQYSYHPVQMELPGIYLEDCSEFLHCDSNLYPYMVSLVENSRKKKHSPQISSIGKIK